MKQTAKDGRLRILGVDPGLSDVGWGLIECDGRGASRAIDFGVIRTAAGLPLARRLKEIHDRLAALITEKAPAAAAIEELYFAKNVKTAMVVAHGRAACILATAEENVELFEYTPLQIKQALTGHGRAPKSQVQAMVRAILGLRELPRPEHAADALAAALCHVHSLALSRKLRQARTALESKTAAADLERRKNLLALSRSKRRRR